MLFTESTEHPNSAWVCEQTEWFAEQTKDRDNKPEMIIHDRDLKFTKDFTKTVKDAGMKTNPLPKGSPNLNGRCERVIETINEVYCWNPRRRASFGRNRGDRSDVTLSMDGGLRFTLSLVVTRIRRGSTWSIAVTFV